MDEEFDELVRKGKKKESEVENMKQLANEVQYAIWTRKLRPGNVSGSDVIELNLNDLQSCGHSTIGPHFSSPVMLAFEFRSILSSRWCERIIGTVRFALGTTGDERILESTIRSLSWKQGTWSDFLTECLKSNFKHNLVKNRRIGFEN